MKYWVVVLLLSVSLFAQEQKPCGTEAECNATFQKRAAAQAAEDKAAKDAADKSAADKAAASEQARQQDNSVIKYSILEKASANLIEKSARKKVAHVEKLLIEAYKLQARLQEIQRELQLPENQQIAEIKKAPSK